MVDDDVRARLRERRQRGQKRDESLPLRRIGLGEQLFELVDHQHPRPHPPRPELEPTTRRFRRP